MKPASEIEPSPVTLQWRAAPCGVTVLVYVHPASRDTQASYACNAGTGTHIGLQSYGQEGCCIGPGCYSMYTIRGSGEIAVRVWIGVRWLGAVLD